MEKIFIDPCGRESIGLCLIIEATTGVVYQIQCGGLSTEINEIEGYIIPIGEKEIETKIFDFFMKHFGENCYKPYNNWTENKITELNEILKEIPVFFQDSEGDDIPDKLTIDEDNIDECIEAWIPIKTIKGKGILTLKNSD